MFYFVFINLLIICAFQLNGKDLVINEFMASNKNTIRNEFDESGDWIELYNNSESSINLNNYYISDNPNRLNKFRLPEIQLLPNNFILVWADELKSNSDTIHTNFKLSAEGEVIILSDLNNNIIDSIKFSQQIQDVSFGRCPDGTGGFIFMFQATPNFNNACNHLKINFYPNPTNDNINIQVLINNKDYYYIILYDFWGNKITEIDSGELSSGNYLYKLNLTELLNNGAKLTKGTYFVKVNSQNWNLVRHFIFTY